jgi:hypothetical protein
MLFHRVQPQIRLQQRSAIYWLNRLGDWGLVGVQRPTSRAFLPSALHRFAGKSVVESRGRLYHPDGNMIFFGPSDRLFAIDIFVRDCHMRTADINNLPH